jgi:hypothetical protein
MDYFIQSPNPKIWGFLIENDNQNEPIQRVVYVDQISHYAFHLNRNKSKNKVLFIYNKVDKARHIATDWRGLYDNANTLYPGIFELFRETNSLLRFLYGRWRFKILPFQAVKINVRYEDGALVMDSYDGRDLYPKELWHHIVNLVRR